jgi:hypothetical protein
MNEREKVADIYCRNHYGIRKLREALEWACSEGVDLCDRDCADCNIPKTLKDTK